MKHTNVLPIPGVIANNPLVGAKLPFQEHHLNGYGCRFLTGYFALLSDVVFENQVENRRVMANFIFQDGAPVGDHIIEILELIDIELTGQ